MNNLDRKYLRWQFRLKIHEKSGTAFQGFFESVMQEAFRDFQKVRPYGNKGDAGNDGYRPDKGEYYQAYAPIDPREKEGKAARKLKEDFEKLKAWDEISKIRTFYFTYNDRYFGTTIEIEQALSELRQKNPEIEFKKFVAKDLEDVFFSLREESIHSLGFDIDSRNALRVTKENLHKLEVYLDRGDGRFALESLNNFKEIVDSLKDEGLLANWEMLECRALQQLEMVKEAKEKYENLCKRYPNDASPFLYLAEICLNEEDYRKNEELLEKAKTIDGDHWLLPLEIDLRAQRLGNKIDGSSFDEEKFPADPKIRSSYYRFYSVALQLDKDFVRAESFVERAISLNPDRFANYITKLGILESQLFFKLDNDEMRKDADKLLLAVEAVLDKVNQWGKPSPRNQAILNLVQLEAFKAKQDYPAVEKLSEEALGLLMQCYFDVPADRYLSELIKTVQLPQANFDKLLLYLREAEKTISDDLAKALILQFGFKQTLFSDGRRFFEDKKKKDFLAFIAALENKKYDQVSDFIKGDSLFAIGVANGAKEFPDLRRKIIQNLPDDGNIEKDKLLLLLNYDENNIEEAFDILKGLDLSKSRYFEYQIVLEIAQKKKAWEFAIVVLDKLLAHEKEKSVALKLKLNLFKANLNLKRLPEAIDIGERILANSEELPLLDDRDKEGILAETVMARLERGDYSQARSLIEAYPDIPKTIEFTAGIEADVYLKNRDASNAIASVVAGMKIAKTPTPEQFARLFLILAEIDNLITFSLDSLPVFQPDFFVKFKDQERWYFVGDGDALDAIPIPSSDKRYSEFLGKEIGAKVVFDFGYGSRSDHIVESILPIEKYIFSQSVRHFNQLAADGNLPGVQAVPVPMVGETVDAKNIIAFLEDQRKGRKEFFDLYCANPIPLAFLASSEGGLTGAIATIQNENKGFIRASSGEAREMDQQEEIAKRITAGSLFYIDGTSALILAETGLLAEIYPHLPNLKVPQSVITMLFKCIDRFRLVPGQAGYLQYVQGKLRFSSPSPDKGEIIQKRFEDSVRILESRKENIGVISAANKADCFSEQRVPPELCDACVLAQRDKISVLTEDYLNLHANEIETKKKAPEYCSAFELMRVLYEQKKITFEKYLDFFAYLSSYRFRFLRLSTDDINKAVFGDGVITMVRPERIKWLNFPLTLSEEYGVSFGTAFSVASHFLLPVLTEEAILPDIAERIFLELLTEFPTDKDKRIVGQAILEACVHQIEKVGKRIILGTTTKKKIERLSDLIKIYRGGNRIWTPSGSV
jgi:hypothetical protein